MAGTTGDGTARAVPSAVHGRDERERAHEAALRLLRVRDRTVAELRQRLRSKGFGPETVEAVLDGLRSAGLLDDTRYASRFAERATGRRGLGSARIAIELRRLGVDAESAASAATEDPDAEEARALAIAQKRAASLRGLDRAVAARRLLGYMARRGFGSEMCRSVVERALDGFP